MIVYGPVPSRRLGRSMGINNIPPKVCTYSCIYCQVGATTRREVERQDFYAPEAILQQVQEKLRWALRAGEPVDYLTLVPDGEPTLDANLGRLIHSLKPLGIKVAVITNASLLWRADVREELGAADWVSLKVDSIQEAVWRRVNRSHRWLRLDSILEGMVEFSRSYRGQMVTETMLVAGVNDDFDHMRRLADFLASLRASEAYLSIPTRPPAAKWVRPPAEEIVNCAYQTMSERIDNVEYLIGYEGNAFACSGDIEADLLSITSVHPMREEAVRDLVRKAEGDWSLVESLKDKGKIIEVEYGGRAFFMRRLA